MRAFDSILTGELAAEVSNIFWGFRLVVDDATTHRWTDCDIDVVYDGARWKSAAIGLHAMSWLSDMSAGQITVTLPNADRSVSAILLGTDCTNKVAEVAFVIIGPDFRPLGVESFFQGLVSGWDLAEDQAEITVSNQFMLWNKHTLRTASELCPWPFKGPECGYTGGAAACDKTYQRCAALGNTARFGGRRFLPSCMEKEIWWGQQQKL